MSFRVIIMIGDQPHHHFLARQVESRFGSCVTIVSKNKIQSQQVPIYDFFRRLFLRAASGRLMKAWRETLSYYEVKSREMTPLSSHVVYVSEINDPRTVELVNKHRPNLVVVSGTNLLRRQLIKLIESKGGKILNLHSGLSPYIRGGPNATFWCLSLGEFEKIGNSVMLLTEGIDSGPLLATRRVRLLGSESLFDLQRRVISDGHDLFIRVIEDFVRGHEPHAVPQPHIFRGRLFFNREWDFYSARRAIQNFDEEFGLYYLSSKKFEDRAKEIREVGAYSEQ